MHQTTNASITSIGRKTKQSSVEAQVLHPSSLVNFVWNKISNKVLISGIFFLSFFLSYVEWSAIARHIFLAVPCSALLSVCRITMQCLVPSGLWCTVKPTGGKHLHRGLMQVTDGLSRTQWLKQGSTTRWVARQSNAQGCQNNCTRSSVRLLQTWTL